VSAGAGEGGSMVGAGGGSEMGAAGADCIVLRLAGTGVGAGAGAGTVSCDAAGAAKAPAVMNSALSIIAMAASVQYLASLSTSKLATRLGGTGNKTCDIAWANPEDVDAEEDWEQACKRRRRPAKIHWFSWGSVRNTRKSSVG